MLYDGLALVLIAINGIKLKADSVALELPGALALCDLSAWGRPVIGGKSF